MRADGPRTDLARIGWFCFLAAEGFNLVNAIQVWGILGGILAVLAFPIMLFVVPIALLRDGVIPLYWLLLPVSWLLGWLALRSSSREDADAEPVPARSAPVPLVPPRDDLQQPRQRRVRLTTIGLSAVVVLLVATLIGLVVLGIRDTDTQESAARASTPILTPRPPAVAPASVPPPPPTPSVVPTPAPTPPPTPQPTASPSPMPTPRPTATPPPPTPSPVPTPSPLPAPSPTPLPATLPPAAVPATLPTPTARPSLRPSASPTLTTALTCTHDAGAIQTGTYVDVRSIRISPTSQPPSTYWNVAGEFFNGCDVPICVSLKSVTHYDAQGRVVEVGTAYAPVIEVPAGGVRSFQFLAPFTSPGLWARSVLVFDEVPKSPQAPAFLCY